MNGKVGWKTDFIIEAFANVKKEGNKYTKVHYTFNADTHFKTTH